MGIEAPKRFLASPLPAHPLDPRSAAAQFMLQALEAAVEVIDAIDRCFAARGAPRR
jgi:hypothetical protein